MNLVLVFKKGRVGGGVVESHSLWCDSDRSRLNSATDSGILTVVFLLLCKEQRKWETKTMIVKSCPPRRPTVSTLAVT